MQRIRFEDRPGGGRVMRLGTEHPGVGTIWDGLEDVKLTSRGLNTSARPDAVRAPMVTGLRRSESGGRSIVSVAPSRSRAASTVRQDDPVKRALMHLDRAMRDQPDRLYSAVRTIQRLLEAEKVPENIVAAPGSRPQSDAARRTSPTTPGRPGPAAGTAHIFPPH